MTWYGPRWLRSRAITALAGASLVGLALLLVSLADAPPALADDGVRWFDGDPAAGREDLHAQPFELGVGFLMDCDGDSLPPSCGNPPARWPLSQRPVTLCSFHAGRPAWLTDRQFRQAIADAATTWNSVGAAISVRYAGDCARGSRWLIENGINEIGFDDARDAVRGSAAAVTRTVTNWTPQANPTVRTIFEADIVIDGAFGNYRVCFATTVMHELGHVLGLSHSDVVGDLMFPTFTTANPLSCPTGPSNAEQARLRELYGVNRVPAVTVNARAATRGGVPFSATAVAVDPEGEAVTYEWSQVGGPPVSLAVTGPTVTFMTPPTPGVVILRVVATDASLHPGSTLVSITVTGEALGMGGISGALPASGFGLFVFSGGTEVQLLAASGCPRETAAFWASDGAGGFLIYVPGTAVAAVNMPWLDQFPAGIPDNTALLGRCHA